MLGRTPEEVFVMLVVVLHFIFVSSFLIFILLLYLHLSIFFIHISFAFRHHPSPFRGLSQSFHTHFILSASPSQSDLQYCYFQPFRYLLTVSATVLSGRFLPTGVFYLILLHRHFNLHLSRLPWEPTVLP